MAFSSILFRRHYAIYCPPNAIDLVERRYTKQEERPNLDVSRGLLDRRAGAVVVCERSLTKEEPPAILSKEPLLTGVLNLMMHIHR